MSRTQENNIWNEYLLQDDNKILNNLVLKVCLFLTQFQQLPQRKKPGIRKRSSQISFQSDPPYAA